MNSQKLLVLVLKLEVSHRSHTISSSQTHRGYRLWIVVSYAATCSAQCDLSQRDNKFSVLHNVPTLTLTCNSLLFDSLRECPINIDSLLIDTVLYFPRLTSNRYSLTWPTVRNSNNQGFIRLRRFNSCVPKWYAYVIYRHIITSNHY